MLSLYRLYDFQNTALAPFRVMSGMTREVLSHPLVPASYTQMGKSIVAGLEVFDSATTKRGKPAWGLDHVFVEGRRLSLTIRKVQESPFCNLLHFKREGVERNDPKILLVAPLSGHYATLLRGTVEALLPDHEVYITDWVDARLVPLSLGRFGLEDYMDTLLAFMRFLSPELNVMAVCQPAPIVLAAVSLLAEAGDDAQPNTMILMGGPIDAAAAPTRVTRFAESHSMEWFERSVIVEVPEYHPAGGRKVYPGFLQLGGFISMNPHRHFNAHMKMFHHLVQGDGDSAEAHKTFYDEYLAVMDVSADYYLETVDRIFKKQALARGTMTWRGHRIQPGAIEKTALLTVEGEKDDISAPGQTRAAHEICHNLAASKQDDHLQAGVGHYGIFNGRRWREEIKPVIGNFIRKHA